MPLAARAAAEAAGGTPNQHPSKDLDHQIERLMKCEFLSEQEVCELCVKAKEILVDEGNVQ
jgi:hypothetical protein